VKTTKSFFETFTDALNGLGSRGGGDDPLTLINRFFKVKYLCKKLIYNQMQGLKFRIPQVGTDVCLLRVLCVVRYRSVWRNYQWSRGVCVRVCVFMCVGVVLCECVCFIDCDHPQIWSSTHTVSAYKSRE